MKIIRTPDGLNDSLFPEESQAKPVRAKPRNREELGIPKGLDLDQYERGSDGRLQELVGSWSRRKHALLEDYVAITSGVRKKWRKPGGTTYVDLFCGPGRVRVKQTTEEAPGSPLVAWNASVNAPFTDVYIADANQDLVDDCHHRLRAAGAPVRHGCGLAADTVDRLIEKLNPDSYHFVFLDPFNLGTLDFDIIRKLSKFRFVDFLLHVSAQDLNRNLRRFIEQEGSSLDKFAPEWRNAVDISQDDIVVRDAIFSHWKSLLESLGKPLAGVMQLFTGDKNQPLYWLALAAKHERAHEFWAKIQPRRMEQVSLWGNLPE